MNKESAVTILAKAEEAGWDAYKNAVPSPMAVVEHESPFDDNSPVRQSWHVSEGACGFAWINVPGNSWFIRELKKHGYASKNINNFDTRVLFKPAYRGGYQYWVGGGQSYERKIAFARAFSDVLTKYGIKNYTGGRLD